jgi:CRISPR-associated endonuclease/helicase Cas3
MPEPREPRSFFARSTDDNTVWQLLRVHLTGVANRASDLCREACPGRTELSYFAELAGLLHDLGKYREQFQEYLKRGNRHQRSKETAHAAYGAAAGSIEFDCAAVAFAVVGHHAGLHDQEHLARLVTGQVFCADRRFPPLLQRADSSEELAGRLAGMKTRRSQVSHACGEPLLFESEPAEPASQRRFEFATRVLFSLLVDADRLDSERFEQEHRLQRAWTRGVRRLDPVVLLQLLEKARRDRAASHPNDDLNRLRNDVFESCLRKGRNSPQGFFTLTVPTGGAKTLSSMAFALSQADIHQLRRVIVVIPYLSIIEQNAREYRTILGANQVLEHHSAVDVGVKPAEPRDDDLDPSESVDVERAMENWDVPVVVTTSVQFIETLFAASPSRARKLHNIARSVVIFDEVQTLPTHLLEPTLDVLRTLKEQFGVTVLFSSATQPAFKKSPNLQHGFSEDELVEIAPQVRELYATLQRVKYRIESAEDRWDWDRLAQEMSRQPQSLSVVNLRQHAFDAWTALKKRLVETGREEDARNAVFHLSSAMCPAHRLEVLGLSQTPLKNNIKQRLLDAQPCWVISTQLIEAGVDIDFPVVFRAMGPLDSIVQAAGRCNREGQLRDAFGRPVCGEVVVFHPQDDGLPNGIYRQATSITPSYLTDTARLATDPGLFAEYFTELYGIATTDRVRRGEHTIQESRAAWNFRTVAERAKVIPDDTVAVIVPYRRAAQLIDRIRQSRRIDSRILRRFQRYTVNLRRGRNSLLEQLHEAGRLQTLTPDLDLLVLDAECYDRDRGIVFRGRSPEDLIV